MSATQRLPLIMGITGAGASLAVAAVPSFRAYASRILGIQAPGGVWRALFFLLAVMNLKTIPFVWHFRIFRALIYQLHVQRTPLPPASLFEPIITSTWSPLPEIDYNFHKSNSTYFTDLDVSRTHLVGALLRRGILAANKRNDTEGGSHTIAFGGVTCHFKREIPPFKKYEIWTRLLAWDRKWIYLVSHFVEAGVVRPKKYTLQPWKAGRSSDKGGHENESTYKERLMKAVFASSISKYVIKKGRVTIPADLVLANSGLLPQRPSAVSATPANGNVVQPERVEETIVPAGNLEWTWDTVEAERLRGLRFAEMFTGLDSLHGEFDGGKNGALGEFPDMLW